VAYCRFWQRKLAGNKDIEFPDRLCGAIADITDGFSFAYIQEAFVAALIVVARGGGDGDGSSEEGSAAGWEAVEGDEIEDGWVGVADDEGVDDGDLDDLVLWVEIKKQIAILREGMEEKRL
jgi:hypothetical protein